MNAPSLFPEGNNWGQPTETSLTARLEEMFKVSCRTSRLLVQGTRAPHTQMTVWTPGSEGTLALVLDQSGKGSHRISVPLNSPLPCAPII